MVSDFRLSVVRLDDYTYPQQALIRRSVPLDAGNRFIKWVGPDGKVNCIPSFFKELEEWEDAESDDQSVLIEIGGKRYIIGRAAQDLKGRPTFEGDKCELAWLLALVAIQPNPGETSVRIEEMPIALPDSRNKEAVTALKQVEGTREFFRNGEYIIYTVHRVVPVDETKAAYSYALTSGLFQYHRTNGILDLGGGTGIGRLYSASGTLIREADTILPGTFSLAQKIGAALTPQLGQSANLSMIMDAIADGSYIYGTTGINFQPLFTKFHADWLEEIRSKLKISWGKWMSEIGEVIVIGGSATLALPLVESSKGRFKLAPNPQTFTIVAMGA